jgi:hypothetical protein
VYSSRFPYRVQEEEDESPPYKLESPRLDVNPLQPPQPKRVVALQPSAHAAKVLVEPTEYAEKSLLEHPLQ